MAGDGTPCGNLFQLTKPSAGAAPTDTIGAMLQILKNPTSNVTAIYNLMPSTGPFMPTLTSAPSDWTLPLLAVPATPTFSLAAGTYSGSQTLTLSDSVAGVSIYYTTNGTTPTTASTLYTGSITVSNSETVEAIAVQDGRLISSVGSAAYTITSATTPTITAVSAVLPQQTQTITITGTGFGTQAAYTGDSAYIKVTDVTYNGWSAGYSGVGDTVGLGVTSWTPTTITISGFSGNYGGLNSLRTGDQIQLMIWNASTGNGPATCATIVVGSGATTCTVAGQTATPTFSLASGSYSTTQSVTLSDATANASIYYTTNGSTPTTSSTLYTGAIAVTGSETINAIAIAPGYTASAVASATYVINVYGIISTVAGNGGTGATGDSGQATSATLSTPYGVAVDTSGNMYIADYANCRIRKVNTSGVISTIAGNGTCGYNGDGGYATGSELNGPIDVTVDSGGNVFVADFNNQRVRKITSGGIITTVAGTGVQGYNGEGVATSSELSYPAGVAIDGSGNLYIADYLTAASARSQHLASSRRSPAMDRVASAATTAWRLAHNWATRTVWLSMLLAMCTSGTIPTTVFVWSTPAASSRP